MFSTCFPCYNKYCFDSICREANNGLVKPIEDYSTLVECMAHLGRIKERQAKTDQMFEPIKNTIELLKGYHVEVHDDVYLQLQACLLDYFDLINHRSLNLAHISDKNLTIYYVVYKQRLVPSKC